MSGLFDGLTSALRAHPVYFRAHTNSVDMQTLVQAGNMTQVAEYYTTHPLPQRYNPGIIVASVAVAVLGSYSTLLLLGKRTSNKGVRNIVLLVLAATTMSSVGIWGMHFIGMHMQLEPLPNVFWYIQFNPGFTVFSLFIPTIALVIAFFFVDDQVHFKIWRICLSGTIVGAIVALMHYSASFKANFVVAYNPIHLTFSILLACLAAVLALFSFFRFRAQWEDSWWKRLVCSAILGAGVAGMHYLGATGTDYYVPNDASAFPDILAGGSYQSTVVTIAIGVMCFAIIVFSTFIAVSDVLMARDARSKARKVVVCSATFDKQGRLLVKQDGTMPMMVIETPIQTKDMLQALDNRQPTFQWLYAVSWDWSIVAPFLNAITSFFYNKDQKTEQHRKSFAGVSGRLFGTGKGDSGRGDRRGSFDALGNYGAPNGTRSPAALAEFRDRFIEAAGQLAIELDIPFEQGGVLYDRVFPTGTRKAALLAANNGTDLKSFRPPARNDDGESSINGQVPSIFGDGEDEEEGLMLFLVRELPNTKEAVESTEKYRQRGYRMTETRFLAGVLADRVAVTKPEMETMLDSLRLYAKRGTRPVVQPGGVYAGLFGVRPSTSRAGGLDVLVYNFARHQIPAYRLPDIVKVTPDMRLFLRMLDQMTMEEAMKTCERESIRSGERRRYLDGEANEGKLGLHDDGSNVELLIQFQTSLFIALDALHNSVRFYPRIAQTARISAEVLDVCSSLDDSTPPAEMILVQAVLPEARASPTSYSEMVSNAAAADAVPTDRPGNGTPFVFTPYTLFGKAQMMLTRGRSADVFEHEVVIELRRRYASSLMNEAEELNAGPHSRGPAHSVLSGAASIISDEKDMDDEKVDVDAGSMRSTQPGSTLKGFRQWSSRDFRKTNKDELPAQSYSRRHSISSVASKGGNNALRVEDEAIGRQQTGISPSSMGTTLVNGSPDRLPPYSQQSLGIRRFTEGGASPNAAMSGTRYIQPTDEAIVEEGTSREDSSDPAFSSDPVRETTVALGPSRRQSRKRTDRSEHEQEVEVQGPTLAPSRARSGSLYSTMPRPSSAPTPRPSTAPNDSIALRQRAAEIALPHGRLLSQRHAAAHTSSNDASVLARLRSDDWSTRQLQSLERGPAGSQLLGVDF